METSVQGLSLDHGPKFDGEFEAGFGSVESGQDGAQRGTARNLGFRTRNL